MINWLGIVVNGQDKEHVIEDGFEKITFTNQERKTKGTLFIDVTVIWSQSRIQFCNECEIKD